MPIYIGVDPGASGGLACYSKDGITAVGMPSTERDVWEWFSGYNLDQRPVAVIEKVGGYVGGTGQPGSAMFKFGASYGRLCMALCAADIPYEEVTPQNWQKGLGIPGRTRKESKGQWKNRLKAHAQKLFPQEKVTLLTADALLIAEFCRRKHEGLLS